MGKVRIKKLIPVIILLCCFTTILSINVSNATNIAYASVIPSAQYVYLGGTPIGITLKLEGAVVDELIPVIGKNGSICPAEIGGICRGDLITMVGGTEVRTSSDIAGEIANSTGEVSIRVRRNSKELSFTVTPEFDVIAGGKKLGIKVKEELAGVGTLTFVTSGSDKHYGALGHKIFEPLSGEGEDFNYGSIYNCNILGLVKGQEGVPGELRGTFDRSESSIGTIHKNNFSGVFGNAEPILYDNRPMVLLGSRQDVALGKAYIYTTIEGKTPQKYEIEVVKAENQKTPHDRSMVIHVTDKALLDKTGGILQGMSGSPIVQNGKLIGAVTHVFINDPTRGYGIYSDWMLESSSWAYESRLEYDNGDYDVA